MIERRLEEMARMANETKKEFTFHKSSGLWYWYNRGDEETLNGPFKTYLEVLADAVKPYILDTKPKEWYKNGKLINGDI